MERRRVTAPGIPCAKSVRVIEAFLPLPASTPQSWSETLDLLPKLYWKQRPWADLNANACKVLQRLEGRINSARHSPLHSQIYPTLATRGFQSVSRTSSPWGVSKEI